MSEIQKLFDKSELRSSKYKKYFLNYDEILSRFKGKDIKIIEIGVQDGGSLKIWQETCMKKIWRKLKKQPMEGMIIFPGLSIGAQRD